MSRSTLIVSSVLALLTLGCNTTPVQNACVPCDTNDCGEGGNGDPFATSSASSGTGGEEPNLCGCQLDPDLPAPQAACHEARVENGQCVLVTTLDGEPCRGGVGKCLEGNCAPVDWNAQCIKTALPSVEVCSTDAACDDGNPCTNDSCPEPGCAPCAHVPVTDLRPCGGVGFEGMICREGACCDNPGSTP